MIYATVNMTVGDYSSTCDQNIVLYRGDKNVEIRFVIKGNRFTVLDSTYAQMIIRRPSSVSIFSEPAAIQNDTVILTITEDMIDELKEIGAYTFQVRLYDNSMNARATLPPCNNCLIINQPIAVEGEALVNAAMVNASAILAAESDIPEDEIFTEDNAYNRTVWMDGDIITDARMNKIENALYYINEKGGGGTATAPYISTSLPETVMVGSGEDFELDLDFSSPNLGKGTLKVFINDIDSMNQKIDQGMSITTIPGSLFSKGTNMVVIYVLDRVGMMSNSLTFYVRYGGTEVTSTFDAYTSYDYGATVRYYFTPTALDTSLQLTFYMEIDGTTQAGVPCISDVRSYYTFPTNLSVGNHYCRAWVTDGTTRSNVLTFNLIILDATSLVVATDTLNPTVEEGTQLVLDYKVYMKNNTSFITKTYVDNNLINTGTCTLETAYYRTTNLTAGTHTIKVEVFDVTETYTDFVTWTVTVTESTYTMLEPAKAGSIFMATAYNKSNVDENREVWIGSNQDDDDITASLSNFSFNSENGWIDDALVISGNSWVEIPIQPLANNAQYGFTLDIEFKTKAIGVEDAEVLTLWNETDNCGIKITTEQLIMRSKTGNQCDLYFPEDEIVSAIFVIDRDEKTAKIYLNGVMCEAFALSDYEAAGQKYLEDFTVNSNVYLGGYNKNGYCAIKNIRIYEVALATNEILNNFMSNEKDKAAQRELVEFQKGNTLPTLTIYCDFSGLGKDDKKPCNIVYNSPDVNLYGESFTLDGKHSMLQYQGTSSMQYPIKNYRINPRNADGKVKLDPFNNGVGESRFTLKADFMSSGHWQNTGMAKFVNDCLYNYNPNDEKSMNPAKWWSLQNGGSLKDTRETINGFPCRLILVNDGETALNEGQQEPTPGNTKDMGIFNFNNDKDNVNTLGLDTEIFPNCISYEVTANSDTSAGAFVPFEDGSKIPFYFDETDSKYVSSYLNIEFIRNNFRNPGLGSAWFSYDSSDLTIKYYNSSFAKQNYDMTLNNGSDTYNNQMFTDGVVYAKLFASTLPSYIQGYHETGGIKYETRLSNDTVADTVWEYSESDITELEYLQNSFELRYPDSDDVGKDYGYLGMEINEDRTLVDYTLGSSGKRTSFISTDYLNGGELLIVTKKGTDYQVNCNGAMGGMGTLTGSSGSSIELIAETTMFQILVDSDDDYFYLNGTKIYFGDKQTEWITKDPYTKNVNGLSQDYGLKRVIDWVGNCTDEEFVADFEKYFNKQYVLRYYLLVIVCGMVDNLGKNMMLDTWDGQIWYPRFYDMDTICSYDNSGEIKFDVDIEMAQGYWNTSSSRLWTKVRDLFHDELVETYNNLRQNNFSYEKFMSYFYDKQIAQIPQTYYNKDYDVKYAPYANEYMGKAHGDGYEHLKRWLKRRLIFTDTLFDYAPSYTNDALTIRANTLDLMSLEIETYTPVYQHVSFYNGNMEKIKIDGKTATTFTGTAQTATDQEVLIYGGSNIKSIKGIQSMNPNSMLIGNATKLTQLDISNCPILTVVNSNKANFSPHTYLNKLDISNCPQLGGQLNISNSPLLQELNALGSAVDSILFPTSVRNLETLRVPKTVTSLNLTDAGLLYTIEMEEGNNLQNISLTNCNNLTETINFDLTQTPTVLLDNSFNGEEIYMSATTNLTLKNMPSLKRVIFTPNSEYSAFDINNVLNGASYKITTFNNPMMTDFITTAPHRLSYKNSEYGDITPNTAFTANTLDLADTQFQNVKFLCTTDIYNLKVPTTMKNFYCDSAMDIDTDVIEDASYEVIHEELIEPYTTNYEGEVSKYTDVVYDMLANWDTLPNGQSPTPSVGSTANDLIDTTVAELKTTDYIRVVPGTVATWRIEGDLSDDKFAEYDKDKKFIKSVGNANSSINATPSGASVTLSEETHYIRLSVKKCGSYISKIELSYKEVYTPNIIPSSANGSLIFNMYSNNTTQPTSTSPYMWDLTGLKLNDFYTYGMNNNVKPSDDSYETYYKDILSVNLNTILGGSNGDTLGIGATNDFHLLPPFAVEQGTIVTCKRKDGKATQYRLAFTDENNKILHIHHANYNETSKNTAPATATKCFIALTGDVSYTTQYLEVVINDVSCKVDMTQNVSVTHTTIPININNTITTLTEIKSITMPQRMPGYSVRLVNADITPDEYPTMLYPKLIDTTLPITGKLDYTAYNGSSLAWAYAYTTGDVNINPLDSRSQGNITSDYNKLYGTDFIDIVDVWVYKDTDTSKLSTNEAITKAYIELTNDNYKTRIDEVLQYYPNCTDLYFFDDGVLNNLSNWFDNCSYKGQINHVTFMEGYFKNVTGLYCGMRSMSNLLTVNNMPNHFDALELTFTGCTKLTDVNIPTSCTSLYYAFSGCRSLNKQFDLSKLNLRNDKLNYAFDSCNSLTYAPILPSNYKGSMVGSLKNTALTQAPTIPQGVTNMNETFYACTSLTTASTIPSSVTIMNSTFWGCTSLTTAPTISSGVTSMYETFRGCTSLTTAPNIPSSVTSLEKTFYGCTALTTPPTIPSGVTSMYETFNGCSSLTQAPNIPDKVWTINACFRGCTSLEEPPTISPNSILDNMGNAFYGCTKLKHGIVFEQDRVINMANAYNGCTSLESAHIPLSFSFPKVGQPYPIFQAVGHPVNITWVGERKDDMYVANVLGSTFFDVNFNEADIQELVPEHLADLTELGTTATLTLGETYGAYLTPDEVFSANQKGWTIVGVSNDFTIVNANTDISTLTTDESVLSCFIELTNDNYKTRVNEALQWYPNCTDLYFFEDGTVTTLADMFNNSNNKTYKSKIKKIEFMDGYFQNLTSLYYSFYNCTALTDISNIPSSVENMYRAFYYCGSLVNVSDLPDGVTNVDYTFYQCDSLVTAPKLGKSATVLDYTFYGCDKLQSIPEFPPNVTKLTGTFSGCSKLTSVPDIPNSVTDMSNAFYNCSRLVVAPKLPNSVNTLSSTFQGCSSLQTPPSIIPKSVTNASGCFNGCTSLVTPPEFEHVDGSDLYAGRMYQNCSKMTTAPKIPNGVNNILGMFVGCSALTIPPTIPDSVTNMQETFNNCTGLTQNPNVPTGVTNLKYAFSNSSITAITIPLTNLTTYDYAISKCPNLTDVTWVGELTSTFNVKNLYYRSAIDNTTPTATDIQELVPEHLGTVTGETLTLGDYISYLTEDEIAQATNKGWIIE